MIDAFGGTEAFYKKLYINSVCPLGFTSMKETGKEVNYNYYDSQELFDAVHGFIHKSIRRQIGFGVYTETAFCFGTGKNEKFLRQLNETHQYFGRIIPLEHPRFIMQYKAKEKNRYIDKYLSAFAGVL